jgi:hypothetical protein
VQILAPHLDPEAIAVIQQGYRARNQLPAATGLDLLQQVCADLVERAGLPEVTAAEHNSPEEIFAVHLLAGARARDGRDRNGDLVLPEAGTPTIAAVSVTAAAVRPAAPPPHPVVAQAFRPLVISAGAAAVATKKPALTSPAPTRTPAVSR